MNNWKKVFGIIWTGQLFSSLSSNVVGYAIIFWLSLKMQSAEVMAYAMMASLLPQIALGAFTGVYVDRWNRKRVMILADTFIAVCTGILCVMFYFDNVTVWQIYVLLGMRSVGSAFHTPAMQASTPLLAPQSELMRINGINQIINSIGSIAGPAIAALLINLMDMTYILMLDIGGAFVACVSLLFVTIPRPAKSELAQQQAPHVLREMKEGIHAIFSKRGLAWILAIEIVFAFFNIPISALYPLITIRHFGGGTLEMSIVEIGWGIGMILGGVFMGSKIVKNQNKVKLITTTIVLVGLTFLLSGFLPPSAFITFTILTLISGLAIAIFSGSFTSLLQTEIEADKLGRVFSTYDSLVLLPSVPGLLATGFIADRIGLTTALIIAGGATCVSGLMLFFIPSVIRLGKTPGGIDKN